MHRADDRIRLLRLHTDAAGFVWFGDDATPAAESGCRPPEFMGRHERRLGYRIGDDVCRVRLSGGHANALLAVQLYRLHSAGADFEVELASPALCSAKVHPAVALQRLWQPEACDAFCGARPMTAADFDVYTLVQSLRAGPRVPESARHIALRHPAWPAVSFTPQFDADAACRLIADIIDPRWFRHPFRAGRLNRLFAHLGLTPGNVRGLLGPCGGAGQGRHRQRAEAAVRAWYNGRSLAAFRSGGCKGPEAFLWRIFGGRLADPVRALLRATQALVCLVAHVWLRAVGASHPEAGFCPSALFRDAAEENAFKRHYFSIVGAG